MKYPKNQFELLKRALFIFNSLFENLKEINPSQLQYLVYQQGSEGQSHNHFFVNGNTGQVLRAHIIAGLGLEGFTKLIDFVNEENFPLYPEGCNDTHIETAVKKALTQI